MHVVFVQEMGSGLAHLSLGIPILREIAGCGHSITVVSPDSSAALMLLGNTQGGVESLPSYPAPKLFPKGAMTRSYPQMLRYCGYAEDVWLIAAMNAWRRLWLQLRPDCIIFDHAPTAALAARETNCLSAYVGHGFLLPPLTDPITPFWRDYPDVDAHSANDEAVVLLACNRALASFAARPLQRLSDIFDNGPRYLTTFRELDVYERSPGTHYWGPQTIPNSGREICWPTDRWKSPRAYAYLRSDRQSLRSVIEHLGRMSISSVINVPKEHAHYLKDIARPNIKVESDSTQFKTAISAADVVISHGGIGSVSAALMLGKPSICLPSQMEQYLIVKRLARAQLGVHVPLTKVENIMGRAIETVLGDRIMKDRCENFAPRNGGLTHLMEQPARIAKDLMHQVEAFMKNKRTYEPISQTA